MLQAIPGVGPLRARDLLEQLGSPRAVLEASAEQLQAVRRIGPELVARIRWAASRPQRG